MFFVDKINTAKYLYVLDIKIDWYLFVLKNKLFERRDVLEVGKALREKGLNTL